MRMLDCIAAVISTAIKFHDDSKNMDCCLIYISGRQITIVQYFLHVFVTMDK